MTAAKPAVTEICLGPECRECGGPELIAELKRLGISAERGHCRGLCAYAPIVHVGEQCIPEATLDTVRAETKPD